jgi:hypothetical protein
MIDNKFRLKLENIELVIAKHGDHDQSSHGSWATGSSDNDYGMSHRPSLGGGAEGDMDGASLDNVSNGIYPDDVYSPRGVQIYGTGYKELDKQAHALIMEYRGKPEKSITIYRAIPKDVSTSKISGGEWVTPIKQYAVQHGQSNLNDNYQILTREVKAKEIFTSGDSWLEWGYAPSAVQKHGDHDQSTHGSWAAGNFDEETQGEDSQGQYFDKYGIKTDGSKEPVGISRNEIRSLDDYTNNGFQDINSNLREADEQDPFYDNKIADLDKLIEESPAMFGDNNLYRIFSEKVLSSIEEGDVLTDKAYLSTTRVDITNPDNVEVLQNLQMISESEDRKSTRLNSSH